MESLDLKWIRDHFPALTQKINGQPVIFFDGRGGTQVPGAVLDAMSDYLVRSNANAHGAFATSARTDGVITSARAAIANFLGCNNDEVVLTHKPTGIRIFCTEERSQLQNKERAMQILRAKLYEMKLREQQEAVTSMRRSQVGTGSRSEKICTYNYKDNRATDHRLGQNYSLNPVLEGDLETLIQSCISLDQQERLAELATSAAN
ncbi:aminotransferase class V-fold PLP-dependent enzyme [Nostoc sp.]|uniref:aminotransferase class V-fold PLP-dependent enzyme n=1 Tax=Nostoc sp. TaxID=1180 RepID=UPI002FF8F438